MPVTQENPGPYASPSAVLEVIRRFRDRGMQTPFTREVLSRAGIAESLQTRTLYALQVLDLIDDEGTPTEVLTGLANAGDDKFQEGLANWLRAAYAEVFRYADPATDDAARVRDAFRGYNPRAQQERMVTLFLTLCQEASIYTPPQGNAVRERPTRRRRPTPTVQRRQGAQQQHPHHGLPQPIEGLLASLPPSRRWSQKRRDDFVKTFEAVLDYCVEVCADTESEEEKNDQEGS